MDELEERLDAISGQIDDLLAENMTLRLATLLGALLSIALLAKLDVLERDDPRWWALGSGA